MRESNGFVMVEWDPQNKIVAGSTNGRLEIRDGEGAKQSYDLEKADLKAGRVLCLAQSKRVEVRMQLFGGSRSAREFVATFEVPARQPAFGAPPQGSTSVAVTPEPEAPSQAVVTRCSPRRKQPRRPNPSPPKSSRQRCRDALRLRRSPLPNLGPRFPSPS